MKQLLLRASRRARPQLRRASRNAYETANIVSAVGCEWNGLGAGSVVEACVVGKLPGHSEERAALEFNTSSGQATTGGSETGDTRPETCGSGEPGAGDSGEDAHGSGKCEERGGIGAARNGEYQACRRHGETGCGCERSREVVDQ